LEILLTIFAGSQYLSDVLIRYPEFFEWATQPERLQRPRLLADVDTFFSTLSAETGSRETWRGLLRRYKKREILRIGIRDICLGVDMREIMRELSVLAEALIDVSLHRTLDRQGEDGGFCVLAFGKLGGEELNYSSDIDLLALSERPTHEDEAEIYRKTMEMLRADLADHLEDGQVYRVDLRLRPFGKAGELVASREALIRYYRDQASLWELQALLKARPVAGDRELGRRFLEAAASLLSEPRDPKAVVESIEGMRQAARRKLSRTIPASPNIKLGAGGIRDLEFLVQGLQLIHAPGIAAPGIAGPRILTPGIPAPGALPGAGATDGKPPVDLLKANTLEALEALRSAMVLPYEAAEALRRDYLFLRRIEHYLQVFENRQTHSLPVDPQGLETLARRLLGLEATVGEFLGRVDGCLQRVEAAYRRYLLEPLG
jgi:glutamate-ammonia-ligase adenylyltransferase